MPRLPDDFRLIFEQSPSPCVVLSPDEGFTILAVNAAYRRVCGRTTEDLVGRPLFDVFPGNAAAAHGDHAEQLRQSLRRVVTTRRPETLPLQRYDVRPAGGQQFEERYWSVINTPVLSDDGDIRWILHHVEEVTDVVKMARHAPAHREGLVAFRAVDAERRVLMQREHDARAQAAAERRKLQEIFSSAPIGIAIFRGPDHLIEFANPYELRIWGRKAEDVIGRTVAEALPEIAAHGLIEKVCDPVFQTGKPMELIELPISFDINGDGNLVEGFFNFVHVPLHAPDGSVDGFMAVAWNVTEAVVARNEAQRLGLELNERMAFERQLIGIVSHDLRTPLHVIELSASVMGRRNGLDPQNSKLLLRLQNASRQASELINDLLDLSQARLAGSIPVRPQAMDLGDLTARVLQELEAAYTGREIAFLAEGDGGGQWDPQRMAQVVQNLVKNALTYSPADTPVKVRISGGQDEVSWSVHNTGAPIPDASMPTLFEPFRRGLNAEASDDANRGVGLGLFIVKHIVDAHEGSVDVTSDPRAGTTFTIRLPRRPSRTPT